MVPSPACTFHTPRVLCALLLYCYCNGIEWHQCPSDYFSTCSIDKCKGCRHRTSADSTMCLHTVALHSTDQHPYAHYIAQTNTHPQYTIQHKSTHPHTHVTQHSMCKCTTHVNTIWQAVQRNAHTFRTLHEIYRCCVYILWKSIYVLLYILYVQQTKCLPWESGSSLSELRECLLESENIGVFLGERESGRQGKSAWWRGSRVWICQKQTVASY